jgi:N-acyl-L-homoserine lactone synthetase
MWSLIYNIRYLYMVVEKRMFRALNILGFTLQRIGPIKTLEGGVESLAALLDWREFENRSKLYSFFLESNNFKFQGLRNSMAAG